MPMAAERLREVRLRRVTVVLYEFNGAGGFGSDWGIRESDGSGGGAGAESEAPELAVAG